MPVGQYLQLQVTTSVANGATQEVLYRLGGTAGTKEKWSVSNSGTLVNGYFVISETKSTAAIGGTAGADAFCLTELNGGGSVWMGKAEAGTLNSTRVKAFFCDGTTCNNLQPDTVYKFARVGDVTIGGAQFTTNSSGVGPGDRNYWSDKDHFGGNYRYHINRGGGASTYWSTGSAYGSVCNGYTTSSGTIANWCAGTTVRNDGLRWRWTISSFLLSCGSAGNIICFVNPP